MKLCGCCPVRTDEVFVLPVDGEEYTGIEVCIDCFIKYSEAQGATMKANNPLAKTLVTVIELSDGKVFYQVHRLRGNTKLSTAADMLWGKAWHQFENVKRVSTRRLDACLEFGYLD